MLARRARTPEERDMITKMAETWQSLADARKHKLEESGQEVD